MEIYLFVWWLLPPAVFALSQNVHTHPSLWPLTLFSSFLNMSFFFQAPLSLLTLSQPSLIFSWFCFLCFLFFSFFPLFGDFIVLMYYFPIWSFSSVLGQPYIIICVLFDLTNGRSFRPRHTLDLGARWTCHTHNVDGQSLMLSSPISYLPPTMDLFHQLLSLC